MTASPNLEFPINLSFSKIFYLTYFAKWWRYCWHFGLPLCLQGRACHHDCFSFEFKNLKFSDEHSHLKKKGNRPLSLFLRNLFKFVATIYISPYRPCRHGQQSIILSLVQIKYFNRPTTNGLPNFLFKPFEYKSDHTADIPSSLTSSPLIYDTHIWAYRRSRGLSTSCPRQIKVCVNSIFQFKQRSELTLFNSNLQPAGHQLQLHIHHTYVEKFYPSLPIDKHCNSNNCPVFSPCMNLDMTPLFLENIHPNPLGQIYCFSLPS